MIFSNSATATSTSCYFSTMATQPESSQNLPKIHPTLAGNLKMIHDTVKPVIWRLHMTWGRKDHQNATLTTFALKLIC
jgi:hypothetical protein